MRRVPIRMKLAAALAVPLLALTAVTFFEVARTSAAVNDVREQTALAKAAIGPAGLITTLQNERSWMSVEIVGWGEMAELPLKGYEETRAATDAAIDTFRAEIEAEGGEVERTFAPALQGLGALDQIRGDIDAYTTPRTIENATFSGATYDRYTGVISPFFDAITELSVAVDDPDLRQGTELADAVAREVEVLGDSIAQVLGDVATGVGIDTPEQVAWVVGKQAEFTLYAQKLRNATGPYAAVVSDTFPSQLFDDVNAHLDQAIATGTVDIIAVAQSVADRPDGESYLPLQDGIAARAGEPGRRAQRRGAGPPALVRGPGRHDAAAGHRARCGWCRGRSRSRCGR